MNKKLFGQRLRFLRKLEQLTQAALAESVGVTVEHLSNLERGASAPSFEMIIRLSGALGIQPASLFLFTPFRLLEEQPEPESFGPGALDWRGYVRRVGVFERDLAARVSHWSDSFREILGLPADQDKVGYPVLRKHTLEEDRRSLDASARRLEQGDSPQALTFRFRRKDGTLRLGLVHAEVERDESGQPARTFGAVMDITEQKRFEQSLEATHKLMEQRVAERTRELKNAVRRLEQEQAERRRAELQLTRTSRELGLLLDTITDGYFDQDLVTDKAYYSPSWGAMLGYDPDELEPTGATWRELVHPDDLERINRDFAERKRRHSPLRLKNEFRIKGKDGAWRWILSQGQVLEWDEEGEPARLVGVHTDITELKRAETELRASEERYQRMFVQSALAMTFCTPDGRLTEVNESFARMLGYQRDELLGMEVRELLHPDERDRTRQTMAKINAGEEMRFQMEKRHLRKDGQALQTRIYVQTLRDAENRLLGVMTIVIPLDETLEEL